MLKRLRILKYHITFALSKDKNDNKQTIVLTI